MSLSALTSIVRLCFYNTLNNSPYVKANSNLIMLLLFKQLYGPPKTKGCLLAFQLFSGLSLHSFTCEFSFRACFGENVNPRGSERQHCLSIPTALMFTGKNTVDTTAWV